ncbi:hypothetical protein [Streptomyces sp. NPDC055105]|uniref:hypothetical protein n=1 Tax=Streptomyces sp. NPDC055105 TaxID=3365719 RepID=UPI0037D3BD73
MRATVAGTLAWLIEGIPAELLAQLGGTLQMIVDNAGRPSTAATDTRPNQFAGGSRTD